MQDSEKFDDIRPFYDSEARGVLDSLVQEPEFIDVVMLMRFPRLGKVLSYPLRYIVKRRLKALFDGIHTVNEFQAYIKSGMKHLLDQTGSTVTVSGLDDLPSDKPCLFISNHRDIALDPAYVNYVLSTKDRDTVRIAIGDNLLSKKYISDLIRVNKSFVVKRSVTGKRAMLEALKTLSEYIRMSITKDRCCVWIAQREGRAKDGCDKTEPALLKMLSLSKKKEQSFVEGMGELNVIPVAISYQFDPCDEDKAKELYAVKFNGSYNKAEHEDLNSIHKGIVGNKGHIHLNFGEPITTGFSDANEMAALLDNSIINNYYVHATNLLAYENLDGEDAFSLTIRKELNGVDWVSITEKFNARINSYAENHRPFVLAAYANPVRAKKRLIGE